VKGNRAGVLRRRDAVHGGAAGRARGGEDPVVELTREPSSSVLRRNPDEVDVGLLRVGLRGSRKRNPVSSPPSSSATNDVPGSA
jgi:hypothetical protein